ARKGASSVSSPSAVRIDDNLPSSQACISLRSTNYKSSRGIQMINGLVVQVFLWNHGINHLLLQFFSDDIVADPFSVLGRDHDRVNTLRNNSTTFLLVLH